jgi:DNA-binding IscR family transcriptional regulator
VRGAKGGYELRRDPNGLRVSEIVALIDGPSAPFEGGDFLHGLRNRQHEALHQLFLDLHDASARILDDTTLADLIPETHREETHGIPSRPRRHLRIEH